MARTDTRPREPLARARPPAAVPDFVSGEQRQGPDNSGDCVDKVRAEQGDSPGALLARAFASAMPGSSAQGNGVAEQKFTSGLGRARRLGIALLQCNNQG